MAESGQIVAIFGESVQIGPWTGGVNYAVPAEDLQAVDMFDCQNIRVGIGGEVSKRGGSEEYNTTAISGSPTITGIAFNRFSASSEKGYILAGTKIWEDDLAGSLTDRSGSVTITAGNDKTFVTANFNGDFYGTNNESGDTLLRITAAGGNAAAADVDSRFTTALTCISFDNRLFWGNLSSGVDRVWRSGTANATEYGANAFYQLGDDVTGLARVGNALSVHTINGIHLLVPTGNAALPYQLIQRANAGTISERSIETVQIPGVGEVILYVREDGIYMFDGDSAQKISWKLDGERYWDKLDRTRLYKSFSVKYPKRNEVWFWLPNAGTGTTQTNMNNAMVYDYVRSIWYGPFVGVERNCAAVLNNEPHCGGFSNGFVFKHESSNLYDDDGSTQTGIDSWFETSAPAPHGTDVMLRWLFCRTSYDVLGEYDILFTYMAPGIAGEAQTITVTGGFDAIQTQFQIGTSAISSDGSLASVDTDLNGYDTNVKLKYTNSATNEDFTIRRAMAVYKPLGRVRKGGVGIT